MNAEQIKTDLASLKTQFDVFVDAFRRHTHPTHDGATLPPKATK